MSFDEFFTDGDKPYSENLNDSLVLTDAFDLSVPLCMPDGFSNGEFSSTLNVTRKCNVGLVTLKSVGSGVTIGTSQISGSGEVVFRVYPNFNCFYKWDKILLEKSGTVDISFRKVDGSGITATVGSDGTISDSSALKQLSEVDVVFSLSDATISNILIWFVNNHNKSVRTGALLEASQLVNINGTVTANDDKAVNGGTVKTALDNLHTTVTGEIQDVEDSLSSDITTGLALKEDVSNKVTILDNSDAHYPTSKAVNDKFKWLVNLMPCIILKVNCRTFHSGSSRPFIANGEVLIDWGDGSDLETLNGPMNHDYGSTGLYTIKVYGDITKLNSESFRRNEGLTSVDIQSNVTQIGHECFGYCSNLSSVIFNWIHSDKIITYNSNWIIDTSSNLKFYIPIGTTSAYTSKGYPSNKLQE